MNKKITFSVIFVIIGSIIFYLGKILGSYSQAIKLENTYPFHLRDVFFENQPSCESYFKLRSENRQFELKYIFDGKNKGYARVITFEKHGDEIKLLVSIIDSNHAQYFDEVWLECPSINANKKRNSDSVSNAPSPVR
jgi:hypothetical protein